MAWSQSIAPTDGFTRPWPTLLCSGLAAAAVYLLSLAMRELPVGLSYAIFTGIGAAGAVALGVVIHGDPLRAGHLLAIALLVAGVVSARLAGAG